MEIVFWIEQHTMMDHVVGCAFHRPAADRVACLTEVVIAHPHLIRAEITGSLTHLGGIPLLLQGQVVQGRYHLSYLPPPEQIQLSLYPFFPLGRLLAEEGIPHLPQPPAGVRPIHNLFCLWEIGIGDALNPRGPIID